MLSVLLLKNQIAWDPRCWITLDQSRRTYLTMINLSRMFWMLVKQPLYVATLTQLAAKGYKERETWAEQWCWARETIWEWLSLLLGDFSKICKKNNLVLLCCNGVNVNSEVGSVCVFSWKNLENVLIMLLNLLLYNLVFGSTFCWPSEKWTKLRPNWISFPAIVGYHCPPLMISRDAFLNDGV